MAPECIPTPEFMNAKQEVSYSKLTDQAAVEDGCYKEAPDNKL